MQEMVSIDWDSVKNLGTTAGVTGFIVWLAYFAIKRVLEIGEEFLARLLTNQMSILQSHEKERGLWMETLKKFNESIDRSASYQREEHARMLMCLEDLKSR